MEYMTAAKARRTTEDTDDPIHPLVAKFAICRDRIRAAGRAFTADADERAKRLMTVLEELDMIGEDFSQVAGDVGEVESCSESQI